MAAGRDARRMRAGRPHSTRRRSRDCRLQSNTMAKKAATIFACTECGAQATKWLGRCPECNGWNTFAEEDKPPARAMGLSASAEPVPLGAIGADVVPRTTTNLPSLDRVLGGGLV